MTELSPAAQAVFAAMQAEIKRSWKTEHGSPASYNIAGAAIRAIAELGCPLIQAKDLLAIANELENHD